MLDLCEVGQISPTDSDILYLDLHPLLTSVSRLHFCLISALWVGSAIFAAESLARNAVITTT